MFALVLVVALAIRASIRAALRFRRHLSGIANTAAADDARREGATTAPHRTGWTTNRRRAAAAFMAVALFGAGVGVDRVGLLGGPAEAAEFGLIREAWDLLHAEYVRAVDLDSRSMAYGAISGMADAVGDTGHTTFLTPDQAAIFAQIESGALDRTVVDWARIPGTNFALVQVKDIYEGMSADLAAALADIENRRISGIILDLRGDLGGLGTEAVGAVSEFLSSGLVFIIRNAAGVEQEIPVTGKPGATILPLVILVDEDTASSAEIVAAALHDADRAELVGVRTAGTGTGIHDYPLADGSQLWIGNNEWLTPSGESVWHVGIRPDFRVVLPDSAQALTPFEVRQLDANALDASGDLPLLRAIERLDVLRSQGGQP